MASSQTGSPLPPDASDQVYVKLSALEAGWIHLPEREFIEPHDATAIHRCPSLCFFVYHPPTKTKIVYDMGLRRDTNNYPPRIAKRCSDGTRKIEVPQDVKESVEQGGVAEKDVDVVMISHVHYDHTGDPKHFPSARYVVGPGSLALLESGLSNPTESWFSPSLLPEQSRVLELPQPPSSEWKPLGLFPHAYDYFSDGSFYLINAPGHVNGHINGLARIGPKRWVLLGSDSCHDTRLLDGICCIAKFEHPGTNGLVKSVHADDEATAKHIELLRKMRELAAGELEVVLAHDRNWATNNPDKFLPGEF